MVPLNIGRNNNADPRWLLPMICRRGKITRQEIGAIRIFERETKFEVSATAAAQFATAVRRADGEEILIEPLKEEFDRRQGKPPAKPGRKPFAGSKPGGKPDWKKRKVRSEAAGS
jgi:ATP-dependent RNA helicase DeaD